MTTIIIPTILTVADWNKKKGVIAKMAGETGIGAALAKLKLEWDDVDWGLIDPQEAAKKVTKAGKMTLEILDQTEPIAKDNIAKVNPVRKELKAVRELTAKYETKWNASKIVPKSSAVHVGKMKTAADQLIIEFKSIDNDWKQTRERLVKEEERLRGIALNLIKPYFASIRKNAEEVKKNATVEVYTGGKGKGLHQNIRGLNASLDRSKRPDWIVWKDEHWKPLSQDSYLPTSNTQVVSKVDRVLLVLEQLEDLVNQG